MASAYAVRGSASCVESPWAYLALDATLATKTSARHSSLDWAMRRCLSSRRCTWASSRRSRSSFCSTARVASSCFASDCYYKSICLLRFCRPNKMLICFVNSFITWSRVILSLSNCSNCSSFSSCEFFTAVTVVCEAKTSSLSEFSTRYFCVRASVSWRFTRPISAKTEPVCCFTSWIPRVSIAN